MILRPTYRQLHFIECQKSLKGKELKIYKMLFLNLEF